MVKIMDEMVIKGEMDSIISVKLPWNRLYGKRVLITGAGGFIASHLVKTLLYLNDTKKAGIKVAGVVRNKKSINKNLSGYKKRKDLEIIVSCLDKPLKIKGNIDFLIHAASKASPKFYAVDPVGILLPNVLGTYHLLDLAVKKKVKKFLYISSAEVYGEPEFENYPLKEDDYGYLDPLLVRSCYAESKRMGENMCISWSHQFGLDVKVARLFHVYGAGMASDDGRVQSDFIQNILKGEAIKLKSSGFFKRTFCYITDAVSAIFTVLLKGENRNAYNIGNRRAEISIIGLAETLVRIFPERKLKIIRVKRDTEDKYLQSVIKRTFPDISKIKKLGWEPKVGIEEGFKQTISNYESLLR
jgi:UDP-glucuronate decarboxylase